MEMKEQETRRKHARGKKREEKETRGFSLTESDSAVGWWGG